MKYPIARGDDIQDEKVKRIMREGEILHMKPDIFLAITPAPEWWTGYSENYKRIKSRIENNKPLDIPYLHIIYNNLDHEGRHRAFAAKELGFNKIPVAILKEAPTKEEMEYAKAIESST